MLYAVCTNCEESYCVSVRLSGQEVVCQHCGQKTKVPPNEQQKQTATLLRIEALLRRWGSLAMWLVVLAVIAFIFAK